MSEADRTLAAEYVLGLLDKEAEADAERRLLGDNEFAQEVDAWRTRFAELDETAATIAPAESLWQRIEQSAQTPAGVEPRASALERLWNSLAALRIASLTSAAAALVLAIVSLVSFEYARSVDARKPLYVAILVNDANKEPGAVVNAFADGRAELIPLTDINVPEGRALEIWTLWDRAVGPRSVGLIDRARTVRLKLDALPRTGADQLFEITLEPATGSPTGRPTGPVLFKGTTTRAL